MSKKWQWWQINVKLPLSTRVYSIPSGLLDWDENTATFNVKSFPGKKDDIGEVLEAVEAALNVSGIRNFSVEARPQTPSVEPLRNLLQLVSKER